MRVTKANPLNLSAARERLGLFVQETEMPAEVAELYQDSQQPTYEQYYEWQMAADQGAGEREEAAVVATLIADHDAFSHVPVGYWRHPLSLPEPAIGAILSSLGYSRPEDTRDVNAAGRIIG